LRIIAGAFKGRRLKSPSGLRIRPALDKVKEAVFDILYDVEGYIVLDLFAGTGSMGLEALSRGAQFAVFVDNWRESIRLIRENIARTGTEERTRILGVDVRKGIEILSKEGAQFDLIFVDPPYLKGLVLPTVSYLFEKGLMRADGVIIAEHHPKELISPLPDGLSVSDSRSYGQTRVTFFKRPK